MHNMLDAGRANRHGNQSSYWHHEPFNRDGLLSSIAVVDRAAEWRARYRQFGRSDEKPKIATPLRMPR
jgi:hypothetical protein